MSHGGFGDDGDVWSAPQSPAHEQHDEFGAVNDNNNNNNFNSIEEDGNGSGGNGGDSGAVISQFDDDGFGDPNQAFAVPHAEEAEGNDGSARLNYFPDEQEGAGGMREEGNDLAARHGASPSQQQQQQQQGYGMLYNPNNNHLSGSNGASPNMIGGFGMTSPQELPPAVKEYNERHYAQIQEREQLNEEKHHVSLQAAQAFLENFHNDRQAKIQTHLAQIKQQESAFFSNQESLKHSNPWAAVVELSDLHKMTEQKKSAQIAVSASSGPSSSRPGSAMSSPIVGAISEASSSALTVHRHQKDVSRMKQLLIELKNTPISPST